MSGVRASASSSSRAAFFCVSAIERAVTCFGSMRTGGFSGIPSTLKQ